MRALGKKPPWISEQRNLREEHYHTALLELASELLKRRQNAQKEGYFYTVRQLENLAKQVRISAGQEEGET